MEVLLTIILAFGIGIGAGYAVISAILFTFRPRIAQPQAIAQAIPLETARIARQ